MPKVRDLVIFSKVRSLVKTEIIKTGHWLNAVIQGLHLGPFEINLDDFPGNKHVSWIKYRLLICMCKWIYNICIYTYTIYNAHQYTCLLQFIHTHIHCVYIYICTVYIYISATCKPPQKKYGERRGKTITVASNLLQLGDDHRIVQVLFSVRTCPPDEISGTLWGSRCFRGFTGQTQAPPKRLWPST